MDCGSSREQLDVKGYLQERALLVKRELNRLFPPDTKPEPMTKASRHLIENGGKYLRPCLALTACEAVGGKAEDALEAAAALEFLHTFTLIHDDIVDHEESRHGVKTVHRTWGEPIAIVAGDALFAKVFEAVAANAKRLGLSGEKVVELLDSFSKAAFEICQGQASDMLFPKRGLGVTEMEYLEMIGKKTGALFEVSTKVGGMLGDGKPEEVNALARYGRLLGTAFQIKDDVLGLVGEQEKLGKPVGSDIREGKITLVVIQALGTLSNHESFELLYKLGTEKISKGEIEQVVEILKRSGAVEYALKRAQEFVSEAKSNLEILRESEAKRFLLALADFAIEREF